MLLHFKDGRSYEEADRDAGTLQQPPSQGGFFDATRTIINLKDGHAHSYFRS